MKILKFKPHLVQQILDGTKTFTWRMNDEKDLRKGDLVELINSENRLKFAEAEITAVSEKYCRITNFTMAMK